jgi:guanylate kinase
MKAAQDKAPFLYCAIPSRFLKKENWPEVKTKIQETALAAGYYPIVPFDLDCPQVIFEDHPKIGRKRAFELFSHLLKFKRISLGLFGIADGTMYELRSLLENRGAKFIRTFPGFDEAWDDEYKKWSGIYGDILSEVRGKNRLFILVGGTAVGKTYWSDRLIRATANNLTPVRRVKNTTTRIPRSVLDFESYNFVAKEEFEKMIKNGCFAEYDVFRDQYYGSFLAGIKRVLEDSHGILALTPKGAGAIYNLRYEINLEFVILKASEELLRKNLDRRGITDPKKQAEIIKEHKRFILPKNIPHQSFYLDGSKKDEKLLNLTNLRS